MEPRPTNGMNDLEVRGADVEVPTTAVVRRGATFESFRFRDYTWFWSGALVSNTGSWMQTYALSIVVYSFRNSELDLGIMNFAAGLPVLLLSVFAGAIADRVDKRRLLIWSQAVWLGQAAALGVLFATGQLSAEHPASSLLWVVSLGLVGGVLAALTFPAWQAMLPDLVPRESLLNAIALNSAQFQTSRLLGPLVASSLVLLGATMGDIFFANAASFLVVIAALAAIRLRPHEDAHHDTGPGTGETVLANLTAGIRYAREHRLVGLLLVSTATMTVFGMPYMMLIPAIADKSLGVGKLGVSYLMATNGLGSLVGALIVAGLPRTFDRERFIPWALLLMSGLLIAFGLSRSYPLSLALSTVTGAAVLTVNSLVNASLQSVVPNRLRARVMALFVMSFVGLMPVSAIIFGVIGKALGPGNAVVIGAIVLVGWSLLIGGRGWLVEPDPGRDGS